MALYKNMKKLIITALLLGFIALPAVAAVQKATLINSAGQKVVVEVGSEKAKMYFGLGFELMKPNVVKETSLLEELKAVYTKLADKLDVFGGQNLGLAVTPDSGFITLPNPTNAAATAGVLGSLPAGTYYLKVTSVDYAGGETLASPQTTCTIPGTAGTGSCAVTLTPTTGAASTRLWVATTTGVYYGYQTATSSTLVATTTSLTAGTLPQVGTAYYFNSGVQYDNTWLQAYATADTLIKSGTTFVHTITYSPTDAVATAGSIAILDAVTAGNNATTTLYSVPEAAIPPTTITLDQVFTDGVYVDFTTTADVNVSISYK